MDFKFHLPFGPVTQQSTLGSVSEMGTHAHFDYFNHSSVTNPMMLANSKLTDT